MTDTPVTSAGNGRPGHVTGARIETKYQPIGYPDIACRPGHVTGARIETGRRTGEGGYSGVAPVT